MITGRVIGATSIHRLTHNYPEFFGEHTVKLSSTARLDWVRVAEATKKYILAAEEVFSKQSYSPDAVLATDQYIISKSKGGKSFDFKKVFGEVRPDAPSEDGDPITGSHQPFITAAGKVLLHVFVISGTLEKDSGAIKSYWVDAGTKGFYC